MPDAFRGCSMLSRWFWTMWKRWRMRAASFTERNYEVILTEAALPDGKWLDVLRLAREYPREVEVIVTDSQADDRFWAEALNLGAYDLLAQPFYEPEVRRILYNACSRSACRECSGGRRIMVSPKGRNHVRCHRHIC